MRVNGPLDLDYNELQRVSLASVENFPAAAAAGMLIFKDKRVMICAELDGGVPVWVPLTQELTAHIHNQLTNASTWTINHPLNSTSVIVQVMDENNIAMIPNEIESTSNTQVVISFAQAVRGKAVLMLGNLSGLERPVYAFEQSFTNTDTWVITHSLGYNPVVRLYIDNQEVQPVSLVHDSVNQTTVTFGSNKTGIARCI